MARETDRSQAIAPTEAEIDALEYVVLKGHPASPYDLANLASLLMRLRPEPDATPKTSCTPGAGSVPAGRTCHRCGGDGIQLTEVNTYGEATCGTCCGSGRLT